MLSVIALILVGAYFVTLGHASNGVADVCRDITKSITSASATYFPGSTGFASDINHWASSSTNNASVCSVEPGTPQDVAVILKKLGATRTPFAVGIFTAMQLFSVVVLLILIC
jgi:hypothetical protein